MSIYKLNPFWSIRWFSYAAKKMLAESVVRYE